MTTEADSQDGLASSHFFLRFRHVTHPVFDLPFAILLTAVEGAGTIFFGRPLFLFDKTSSTLSSGVSDRSDLLMSLIEAPSESSTFRRTSSTSSLSANPSSSSDDRYASDPIVDADKDEVLDWSMGDPTQVLISSADKPFIANLPDELVRNRKREGPP